MEQTQVLTFLNNKDRDLLLQFCGYSTTEPLHSFGPVVRPHYIIHFILNGKDADTYTPYYTLHSQFKCYFYYIRI